MIHSTSAHPWRRRVHNLLAVAATILGTRGLLAQGLPGPVVFHVSLGQASATPVSGRLLIFAKPLAPGDKRPVARVDMDQIDTHATAIAAQEVARLAPGARVDLDADISAFPTPFSQLKPGHYAVQAVLDRDHSYNYTSGAAIPRSRTGRPRVRRRICSPGEVWSVGVDGAIRINIQALSRSRRRRRMISGPRTSKASSAPATACTVFR